MFAHSPKATSGIPAQTYKCHIDSVTSTSTVNAIAAVGDKPFAQLLIDSMKLAGEFHDLGKLDVLNQAVLSKEGKGRLPVNHVDAGVAAMHRLTHSKAAAIASLLIYSHHRGLPDFSDVLQNNMRDIEPHESLGSIKQHTDALLDDYLALHSKQIGDQSDASVSTYRAPHDMQIMFRMALSCLVDADHTDTARNYRQSPDLPRIELRATDRLERLDRYVAALNSGAANDRNALRTSVYQSCRSAPTRRNMVSCDSPVGSGKTTAVMAHLLRVAADAKMRRVFVVLPYTNIITQSVDVYRRSLVLDNENPERVVAAHHHRADFEDLEARHLTYLWQAPIVVTTAVQFFETLAAASTGSLRKLHQLASSAIFIDESHAALPSHLWPIAWRWLQQLNREWNCHFVLGSGSLSQFWTLPEFSDPPSTLGTIVAPQHAQKSQAYESTRINFRSNVDAQSLEELVSWISHFPGPRLLIVNTVQSAAYISKSLGSLNRSGVEHLSTSLTPCDREISLSRIRKRLSNNSDRDWTLVATSCVEAGVDISFRTGFRERSSLNSLLQTSGRVNRSGEYGTAEVWDIQFKHDCRLRKHPAFDDSSVVVGELFDEGIISPQFCTEAMRREIRRQGMKAAATSLIALEQKKQFAEVAKQFKVIDSNTETAVVDKMLLKRLRSREKVSFDELQGGSVQIYSNRRIDFAINEIPERPGLFEWTLNYDGFLGYMAGVIEDIEFVASGGACV